MRVIAYLMVAASLLVPALVVPSRAQEDAFGTARSLVDRVSSDLRHAERVNHDREKERERYTNAAGSLSSFDKELTRSKFDKGKLDAAINDLKNVVNNNTLDPSDRDALTRDLEDLRALRSRRY